MSLDHQLQTMQGQITRMQSAMNAQYQSHQTHVKFLSLQLQKWQEKCRRLESKLEAAVSMSEKKAIALNQVLDAQKHIADKQRAAIDNKIKLHVKPLLDRLLNDKHEPPSENQFQLLKLLEKTIKSICDAGKKSSSPHLAAKIKKLTPSENILINLIHHQKTNAEICDLLNISRHTLYDRRKRIRKKLNLTNKGLALEAYLAQNMRIAIQQNFSPYQ